MQSSPSSKEPTDDRSDMTAWAMSPAYGRTVALGPAQRDVLEVVMRLTTNGRRPELTLGRLAVLTGRPVSSVHDALGRLRALGLVGVSARMGRHGGHRLWRVRTAANRGLDRHKRRLAIARLIGRWWRPHTIDVGSAAASPPAGSGPVRAPGPAVIEADGRDDPVRAGTPSGVPRVGDPPAAGVVFPPTTPADPPRQTPPPAPTPFGASLRRAAERQGLVGLVRLIDEWTGDRS